MPPQRESFQPRPREEILIGLDAEHEARAGDLEDYDPSQRAEILAVMSEGPVDGGLQVALVPDEG